MRYLLNIKDGAVEFEGIGRLPLSEVIISMGSMLVSGSYFLALFKHAHNFREYGSCPLGCEVCMADKKKLK